MDGAASGMNYDLREEIRAYWSERAETFDQSPGHEIFSESERAAWHRLLVRHLGPADGRAVLDLACGTGVVSHLLDDLGFRVTGLDWSEAMLDRAKAKAGERARQIAFHLGDAERLMEDDESFDVVVTRHLVWTLVDPAAAFAEWRRVLKPGGTLLIVDGDFVQQGRLARLIARCDAMLRRTGRAGIPGHTLSSDLADRHRSILSRVHFREGARSEAVSAMLEEAGFAPIRIDARLGTIHRAQARHMPLAQALARQFQHRYAISAQKPLGQEEPTAAEAEGPHSGRRI